MNLNLILSMCHPGVCMLQSKLGFVDTSASTQLRARVLSGARRLLAWMSGPKDPRMAYLSQAVDIAELERRMRVCDEQ